MGQNRITVDELGDLDAMIVTIDGARVQAFGGNYLAPGDEKVVLTFKEFGDAEYVCNATSYYALKDRYGKGTDDGFRSWIGQPCVLVRAQTTDPRSGDKVEGVWIAKPAQWAEVVQAYAASKKSSARPAARKRGR